MPGHRRGEAARRQARRPVRGQRRARAPAPPGDDLRLRRGDRRAPRGARRDVAHRGAHRGRGRALDPARRTRGRARGRGDRAGPGRRGAPRRAHGGPRLRRDPRGGRAPRSARGRWPRGTGRRARRRRRSRPRCGARTSSACAPAPPSPWWRRGWLGPGVHLTSVGYAPPGGELDPALARAGRLLVESRDAFAPPPAGCAELAGIDPASAAELGEVVTGARPGRERDDELTVYKSMGTVIEDVAADGGRPRSAPRRSAPGAASGSSRALLGGAEALRGGLEHAEQLADAADQQLLLVDLDPDAGRGGEDDVVARADGHGHAGGLPPVDPRPDREHDPVLGRRLVRARRHDEARLADPVRLELLDDHPVEEGTQLLAHAAGTLRGASGAASSIAAHARTAPPPSAVPRDPARARDGRGAGVDGRRLLGQPRAGRLGGDRGAGRRRRAARALRRRGAHDQQPDGVHGGARGAALAPRRQHARASSPTRG